MELWLSPGRNGTLFASDEERRALWARHRDRLMQWFSHGGHRPWGWWKYEAPIRYPGYDRERSTLYERGLLTEAEVAELMTFWRRAFDRAHRPDFFIALGPGRILNGAQARPAQYAWADIPADLVEQWTAELGAAA